MRRREFNKNLAAATAVILSPFPRVRNARAAAAGGATLVFSYPNGFAGASNAINIVGDWSFSGSAIKLINAQGHNAAGAWYKTQQPPTAFTTTFSFQPLNLGSGSRVQHSGMTFGIQNTVAPPGQPGYVGDALCHDANMCGWGGAIDQYPPIDSVCVKFDAGSGSSGGQVDYRPGSQPSNTGLYFNGGPSVQGGGSLAMCPFNDLNPYGINFYSGHTFNVTIVYDGSVLVMVLLDTVSNAQARFEWPLNLAYTTNTNGNYVGFTAGTADQGSFLISNWSYWSGYNTRLASPTFTPTPGQYPGTQQVTIAYPPGSTCYYTTNGLSPTSSSTQYTGPITVSANAVIQAVAIQAGYTDSYVATGTYQIGTSNVINFPSGFAAGNLIPVGYAYLSGSSYRLTDTTNNASGAVWFPAPVNIQAFSTTFALNFVGAGQGMCFVIQNNPPPYSSSSGNAVSWSGGPTVVGVGNNSLGYGGLNFQGSGNGATAWGLLNSVGIAFCMFGVGGDPSNSVGLYTNGANPFGSQIATGLNFGGGTFNVTLSYDGTTLSLSMQNTGGGPVFTRSWTINIPSKVGGSTAYVGFTGGTGGAASVQAVQSWTFTAASASQGQTAPPVPAAPTNLRVQ
jgi:hypothetical protein